MALLSNWIEFFSSAAALYFDIKLGKNVFERLDLDLLVEKYGASLEILKKMREEGIFIPAALTGSYGRMMGIRLSEQNYIVQICIGAIAGAYDDLFDTNDLMKQDITKIMNEPDKFTDRPYPEGLFAELWLRVRDIVPKTNEVFFESLENLHDAQENSKKQKNIETDLEEIAQITQKKGGYSTLLYFSAFNPNLTNEEQEAIYAFGAWAQLIDDIMDIEKDLSKGIRTLATETKDKKELFEIYTQYKHEVFKKFKALDQYDPKKISKFLFRAYVASEAFTLNYFFGKVKLSSLAKSITSYNYMTC